MYYMYGGGKQYLDEISLLFLNLDMVLKISLSSPGEFTFIWQSKWVRVLICDENWKKANSLFKRCCCCCHHPWIITSLIQWSLNVMTGQGTHKLKYLCYNKVLLYQGSFLYIFFSWGLKNSSLYRSRTLL